MFQRHQNKLIIIIFLFSLTALLFHCSSDTTAEVGVTEVSDEPEGVENGIHVATGLVYAEGFEIVSSACTGCHSAKLITQSRATREGWIDMIRWMQKTQGLWDLGEYEKPIVDYLAEHYAPEEEGRRQPLKVDEIEWYVLEVEE